MVTKDYSICINISKDLSTSYPGVSQVSDTRAFGQHGTLEKYDQKNSGVTRRSDTRFLSIVN